jgi:hypothetical protein
MGSDGPDPFYYQRFVVVYISSKGIFDITLARPGKK